METAVIHFTVTKWQNDNYDMTVEINSFQQAGYKVSVHTGTITVKDKQGNTVTKTFYGECGC